MESLVRFCTGHFHVMQCQKVAANPMGASLWLPVLVKKPSIGKVLRVQSADYSLLSVQCEAFPQAKESSIQPKPDDGKSLHVKFKLQKACHFGQRFFLTGEHPMLGLWDPENAIPMNWSEDHIWTTELDLPVGEIILFKFILKSPAGTVEWQPGADRAIETLKTTKIIAVQEDWEKAELQNITEETESDRTNQAATESKDDLASKLMEFAGISKGVIFTPDEKATDSKEENSTNKTEMDPGLVPGLELVPEILSSKENISPDKTFGATSRISPVISSVCFCCNCFDASIQVCIVSSRQVVDCL